MTRTILLLSAVAFCGDLPIADAQTVPAAPAAGPTAKAPAKRATAKVKPAAGQAGGDEVAAEQAAKKKRDPAEAQRQIDTGIKLYQDGKAEPAVQTLTHAMSGGGLPPPQMGRALYYRGMAYRKAGKPAQAISDLTSALWLKNGLTDADRSEALKQRSEAYREAGLPDQTDSDGKVAGVKPASASRTAEAPKAAPAASGNFLASLFGGGPKAPPPPPADSATPRAASPAASLAPQEPSTSGWSSGTATRANRRTATPEAASAPAASVTAPPTVVTAPAAPEAKAPRQRTAAAPPPLAPAPATAPPAAPVKAAVPDGKFRARVALVRSRADAEAIVARLRVQHAAAIGNAATDVTEASFGNMGSFFQVRVGPFANQADASSVCTRLKGSGLDCVPVDR